MAAHKKHKKAKSRKARKSCKCPKGFRCHRKVVKTRPCKRRGGKLVRKGCKARATHVYCKRTKR